MSEWLGSVPPYRNRWVRILVVSLIMYLISMVDRTNISMAIPSMQADLGLGRTDAGFATGTFFFGYLISQVPLARVATNWSAKWVIFGLLIFWGTVSASTAFVHTELELVINRLLFGIAEGAVMVSTLVLISRWFTRNERARANTVFLLSIPLGSAIANPVSGLVLNFSDWHWMFIIEALPCFVWAVVWALAIADRPEEAAWLPAAERERLSSLLIAEKAAETPIRGHWTSAIWNPSVIVIALYNFFALAALWAVLIWMPSLLRQSGLSILSVGFLSAIPYVVGAVAMVLAAISSDRHLERKWHVLILTVLSGAFLLAAQLSNKATVPVTLCLLTLSFASFYGRFGPFWALPAEVLPTSVAGVGIAVIAGVGNLGGFVGPLMFGAIQELTGSFSLALSSAGLMLVLSAMLLLLLRLPSPQRFDPHDGPARAEHALTPLRSMKPRSSTLVSKSQASKISCSTSTARNDPSDS
jgi:MFS family permease